MKYKEILCYLDDGCIVRSCDCEYKVIDYVINWRWIGEDEWTPLINKDELEREWLVVGE